MRTIEEIKGACRIDDETGCWLWSGAVDRGQPKIYAPDWSTHNGAMRVQTGQRAVWHILRRPFVPSGWRVYSTCRTTCCLNPDHLKAGSQKQWGRDSARSGALKGNIRVLMHLRKLGQQRSVLTAETYAEILASDESNVALARRLRVSDDTVSKAKRGRIVCFQPLGGLFSGLLQGGAMIAIGIDPGLKGAIALICSQRGLLDVEDIPTCSNGMASGSMMLWVDADALSVTFANWSKRYDFAKDEVHVAIERPIAMPRRPAQTTASQFDTFGVLRAIAMRLGEFHCVDPKTWKKIYGLTDDKEAARDCARRCYSNSPVKRVMDHNRADAILIGHWLKREIAG